MSAELFRDFTPKKDFRKYISIEGNIGSGKSTALSNLEKEVDTFIFKEPLACWGNWLEKYYQNPKKYCFSFQLKILICFYEMIMNNYINGKDIVSERCPESSKIIFAQMAFEDGNMDADEYTLYNQYCKLLNYKPTCYIYIKTPPNLCFERMNQRGRIEESEVNLEYLEKLHQQHEKVFVENQDQLNCPVYIIDGTENPEIVRSKVKQIIKTTLSKDLEGGYYKKYFKYKKNI